MQFIYTFNTEKYNWNESKNQNKFLATKCNQNLSKRETLRAESGVTLHRCPDVW